MFQLYDCVTNMHDPRMVLLAALVCILGAHACFALLRHVQQHPGSGRLRGIAIAAFASGSATWATHFIAMLAYQPVATIGYDPGLTLFSLLTALLVAACAFALALRGGAWHRLTGGALLGLGIGTMHYTGMAAWRVGGAVLWDDGTIAMSLLIGVGFGALALRLGLAEGRAARLLGPILLTLAICGLHFTGMTAMLVLPDMALIEQLPPADSRWLAYLVGAGGIAILLLSLYGLALQRRDQRQRHDEMLRMRHLADAAVEGLLVCDGERLVTANQSLELVLGRKPDDLAGLRLEDLVPDSATRSLLLQDNARAEGDALDAEGRSIPMEMVSRTISYGGAPHRVIAFRDLRDRRAAEAQIRHLAHHDALTGLGNRANFGERLALMVQQAHTQKTRFAVLALDLDRFKLVNDTLGHPVGDALLVEVASRLRDTVRDTDLIGRLGGDEFAVLQSGGEQPEAATALASRMVSALARPFFVDGQVLNIGTSIGIALFPQDGADSAALLRNADLALYRAKTDGRGVFRFFEKEMDARMQERRRMELDLREAPKRDQFELAYQPLLGLDSNRITGFEALLRWRHPERGLIPPAQFVPLAEETGLIVPIGEWVLREACREAASWPGEIDVAVNLSAVQFRSPDLLAMVQGACAAAGLPPQRLELEITESVLLADTAGTLGVLHALRALGIRVSLDDFGTGYSSLSYLRSFPFDKIKIDRSFIADMNSNPDAASIVRAILGLGRSLGIRTTVEGIETAAQLEYVREEGCDQVQGYLIGQPKPASSVAGLLREARIAA
ncbi:EAL domain-containing protein [Roseomonas frigidaquae]|uniref:EAL domain-containing protein n=1 Tax=Falsiroseomonas frigidaquae TaxID=487318 RepID=A0ABX1EY18_9PROT|nr:EAL domain-containing protein [Falsiroseomonas frigidaquae]NKE45000.1 EAL domain-containing protein [Falsiroseomonas frigidaquae]